ncbi:MAG: hypothetical protein WB507_06035 [Solirubrobacterales bacterium]
MTARSPSSALETEIDCGGERLHAVLVASCNAHLPFADRVETALRAALELLAKDPDLARLLTVESYLDGGEASPRYHYWRKRFGAILRRAAAESPEVLANPSFVEPALIGGLSFQIARRVLARETDRLEELLPGFTDYLLAYYSEPSK